MAGPRPERMSEAKELPHLVRDRRKSDILVLAATFFLTVFVDLTMAIGVGTLAGIIMQRARRVGELPDTKHDQPR